MWYLFRRQVKDSQEILVLRLKTKLAAEGPGHLEYWREDLRPSGYSGTDGGPLSGRYSGTDVSQ
jgi:hypothetical protein